MLAAWYWNGGTNAGTYALGKNASASTLTVEFSLALDTTGFLIESFASASAPVDGSTTWVDGASKCADVTVVAGTTSYTATFPVKGETFDVVVTLAGDWASWAFNDSATFAGWKWDSAGNSSLTLATASNSTDKTVNLSLAASSTGFTLLRLNPGVAAPTEGATSWPTGAVWNQSTDITIVSGTTAYNATAK